MKKTVFLLWLVIAIFISGCDSKKGGEITRQDSLDDITWQDELNEQISIYSIDDELIVELYAYHSAYLTDDSLVYSQCNSLTYDENGEVISLDYYRYCFETGETVKLGTIDNWFYESRYNTTLINNQLYLLVTTTDESEEYPLNLYKIDLDKNILTLVYSELYDSGLYNSMTVVGDKLLIIRPIRSGGSYLVEYDTVTGEKKTLLSFDFDNETSTGEAIRQITSNDETISLLRLKTNTNVNLYVDFYDHDMNFLKTVDITSISDDNEELRQAVSCFYTANDYIYYESFSITRFFGEIISDELTSVMELHGNFFMATELEKNRDNWAIYEFNTNNIYMVNPADKEIKKAAFYDESYMDNSIMYIMRAGNDSLMIEMGTIDRYDSDWNELPPDKYYYLNLSDLVFE